MLLYADYNYYVNDYKGTLSNETFDSLIIKASREIDININTRLTEEIIESLSEEAQEQLKYTACALADLINRKNESDNKTITSYSIDGVTKNLKTISEVDYKTSKRDLIKCLPIELICYL